MIIVDRYMMHRARVDKIKMDTFRTCEIWTLGLSVYPTITMYLHFNSIKGLFNCKDEI